MIFHWWIQLPRSLKPRIVPLLTRFPLYIYIIFADVSFKDGEVHLAAFLFHRGQFISHRKASAIAHGSVPEEASAFFAHALPIAALEFFAIALSIFEWKEQSEGECVTLYTDNTAAFGAILHAGSQCGASSTVTMRL